MPASEAQKRLEIYIYIYIYIYISHCQGQQSHDLTSLSIQDMRHYITNAKSYN